MPPHSESCYGNVLESWLGDQSDLLCSGRKVKSGCTVRAKKESLPKFKEPRNVRFFPEVQIYKIPSRKDLSRNEINAMYLSQDEMDSIHRECWKIVDLMNLGIEYVDEEGFSKRGLVDLKDEAVEKRRKLREQAYKIVFGVQAFQAGKDVVDTRVAGEVLAELYRKQSAPAMKEAHEVAVVDAMVAGMA